MAVLEDGEAPLVVPVVDDRLERDQVTARRHRLEEVAADHRAAVRDALHLEVGLCSRDHLGRVEDDAGCRRIGSQDRGEEAAVASADINDLRERRKS